MAILRKKKTGNFTTISNTALKDTRLSFKAKGLLVYMWSLPDDWVFYESELTNHATDGIASVRSGLEELQACGYMLKQRVRNEKGQLGENDWLIHDEPTLKPELENLRLGVPDLENPNLDNPNLEKLNLDNHTLLNTNTTKDLSKPITNKTNRKSPAPVKRKYGDLENVLLTDDEFEKLKVKFPKDLNKRLNDLSYYIGSTGKVYKSHYTTILNWARKDQQNQPKQLINANDSPDDDRPEDVEMPF